MDALPAPASTRGIGDGTIAFGRLVFSLRHFDALLDGRPLGLKPAQLKLLLILCEANGVISERCTLFQLGKFPDEYSYTNLVDVHISRIREILRLKGLDGLIVTCRGKGYFINHSLL